MSNWRERARCRGYTDLWFDRGFRASAVHICRTHCPVVQECMEWAIEVELISCVAGGIVRGDRGEVLSQGTGKASKVCGPDCRAFRNDRQEE